MPRFPLRPLALLLPLLLALPGATRADGGDRIVLLTHADSRGELRPCHCPGSPAGGLSRRSGVISRVTAGTEPVVLADAGGFVPGPEDSLREAVAEFMVEAMELMPYDAVGVGEEELILGPGFLRAAAARLPLVCANLSLGEESPIPAVRWVERGNRRVAVTAVVDPLLYYEWSGAFERDPSALTVTDPVAALTELLPELEGADLLVVLAHADLAGVLSMVESVPGIDVIVQGHDPELGRKPVPSAGAWVVEPGERSRQLVRLTLEAGEEGWDAAAYQVLDLKRATLEDGRIDAMLESFEAEHGSR